MFSELILFSCCFDVEILLVVIFGESLSLLYSRVLTALRDRIIKETFFRPDQLVSQTS